MALRVGNPISAIKEAVTPSELSLSFKTGFILEFRHARGALLPAALRAAGNDPKGNGLFVFNLNPSQYTITNRFANTKTPVQSNEVLTEESGIIMRDIVFEGSTGLHGVKKTDILSTVSRIVSLFTENSSELAGISTFLKLAAFFEAYSNAKKDPEIAEDLQMVLHVLRTDDHFLVVPESFTVPRDARSRAHFKYRIEMTAIARVKSNLPPVDQDLNLGTGIRAVTEGWHDTRAAFAEVNALTGTLKRKVGNISATMLQVAGLINSAGNFVNGVSSLIDAPRDQFRTGQDAVEDAGDKLIERINPSGASGPLGTSVDGPIASSSRRLSHVSQGMSRMLMKAKAFAPPLGHAEAQAFAGERRVTGADIANQTAGGGIGSRTRVLLGSGSLAGLDLGNFNGAIEVVLRAGDTVEKLADQYGSNKEAIILLNDLDWPYIQRMGGPGLKKPGDTILVPVTAGADSPATPSADYLTPEEALYGIDFKLDEAALTEGHLDLAVNVAGTDLALARGVENLVQGLNIITHTELGSTKFIRRLGIRKSVGIKGTLQNMLFASVALREAILSDPRVEGINEANVILNGDSLEQEITPRVVGKSEGIPIVIPFGRASGV